MVDKTLAVRAALAKRSRAISVIVPVLDEEARLARQLQQLARLSGLLEVIVVDGGSADATLEVARRADWVQVIEAPRGRAAQMNAGAAVARGDVLLFLHADVSLPPGAAAWIERVLGDPGVVAGAFKTWTVPDAGAPWFSPLLHLADLRSRYTRRPYGDQAIFVDARAFALVGGFPELPLMEDYELGRRLASVGRIARVPARVEVSGRRFIARPIYYAVLCNLMPLAYRLGISPALLGRLYGCPRRTVIAEAPRRRRPAGWPTRR